jgi:hypothetical protein
LLVGDCASELNQPELPALGCGLAIRLLTVFTATLNNGSQPRRSPNIYISAKAAAIAVSSTDQPVRAGLSATRYLWSRAGPAVVAPGAVRGMRPFR